MLENARSQRSRDGRLSGINREISQAGPRKMTQLLPSLHHRTDKDTLDITPRRERTETYARYIFGKSDGYAHNYCTKQVLEDVETLKYFQNLRKKRITFLKFKR